MSLFDQVDEALKAVKIEIISNQTNRSSLSSVSLNPCLKPAKPEKLKFLKPCSICFGREFTHRENGGFFCKTCQPGIEGHPVIAMGHRKPPEKVAGLPCAGCGSTTWTKEKDGFQFHDGSIVDGWYCGGDHCQIKLLNGNKASDREMLELAETWQQSPVNELTHKDEGQELVWLDTGKEMEYFRVGYVWIVDHIQELLASGWTRPKLFRRSKFSWPMGPWGAAWLGVWLKPDLQIRIGNQGELIFTFSSSSRIITQRIFPIGNSTKNKNQ